MQAIVQNDLAAAQSAHVERLLADMESEIARGLVPLWIYNDPDIYRLELERVFARNWVFVAHETELPNAGDFATRTIGEDPFIVIRGDDGAIRVLFNSCRHRGARVCPADRGTAKNFLCPYHGWTYRNDGSLEAVPQKQIAYKGLDASAWGLMAAPRVESYRGLVFAALDADVPPLAEYLGDFRWYLDIHLGLAPEGMEVLGEPHRWFIDADWKSGAENFSGDSYHTQTLHRSVLKLGLVERTAAGGGGGPNDVHVTECGGHTTSIRRVDPGIDYFFGYPKEVWQRFAAAGLSAEQFMLARRSVVHTGNIFPNLSLLHVSASDDSQKPPTAYLTFRQWQPRGPGRMEVWSWILAPKNASAEFKRRSYKSATSTFGPAGTFEQDDTSVWTGVARAAKGVFAKAADIRLNYQMGLAGMSEARVMTDWPGPGVVYDSNLEEGVQRTFFRHWRQAMSR